MFGGSLRKRITFWFSGTVILTVACVLLVLQQGIRNQSQEQLTIAMESTQSVFLAQQEARAEGLSLTAGLLGEEPKLGAAIAGPTDVRTIQDLAQTTRPVAGHFDVLVVTNKAGVVVGDTRTPPAIGENEHTTPWVADALHGIVRGGTIAERGRIYQIACAPVLAGGEIVGTVRLGLEASDTLTRSLQRQTGSEVSFFNGSALVASSLPNAERPELRGWLEEKGRLPRPDRRKGTFLVSLGGRQYLSLAGQFPVLLNGKDITYVIQKSLSDALKPYRDTQRLLLIIGLFGLICAALIGYVVASGIADPLLRIVRAAEALGRGDWSQRVDAAALDEVGVLARTFNSMAAKLQTWDADLRHAVAERTAQLDAAFQQFRRFNADASHELRTPLTIVRGEAEVALRSTRPLDEYQRVLQSILEETQHMGHIIDDLLLLARADSGELKLERTRLALHDLLLELQQPAGVLARQRELGLTFDVQGPLFVQGDALRLHQLFLNLLDNATKYTPAGGSVRLTAGREQGCAVVRVADTGIGIDPRHVPHLFERFFRVDKARSREIGGSGLGLSICKWIVDAHEGTISVSSGPREGTVFTVKLQTEPVVRPSATEAALSATGPS